MKTRLFSALLAFMLVFSGCAATPVSTGSTVLSSGTASTALPSSTQSSPPVTRPPADLHEAVYLGVENYGTLSQKDKADFVHLFFRDGVPLRLRMAADDSFSIQNRLIEGQIYLLETDGDTLAGLTALSPTATVLSEARQVYSVRTAPGGATVTETALPIGSPVYVIGTNYYALPAAEAYTPPVSGTPGLKTLKNFLATALMPVGTALYVYGGGWNWQDTGSSAQATTIGLPESWVRFFQSQDKNYHYRSGDAAASYFPNGGWNQYYYAGADCSGYLGWVVYNTMQTQSGLEGYVGSSTKMAADFAARGWGTLVTGQMQPGDILSMSGHVYISLGTCSDGSVLILHSTPNTTGGAGVQLSAIGSSKSCQAYALAKDYMNRFYPAWAERYGEQVLCLSAAAYAPSAHFRWNLSGALEDPDGLSGMTPEQILAALYGT